MDTVTQPEVEETVTTTVAAPVSVWSDMKKLAVDRKTSSQSLWIQAAREFLAREAVKEEAA